jgi:hypothetical protein
MTGPVPTCVLRVLRLLRPVGASACSKPALLLLLLLMLLLLPPADAVTVCLGLCCGPETRLLVHAGVWCS